MCVQHKLEAKHRHSDGVLEPVLHMLGVHLALEWLKERKPGRETGVGQHSRMKEPCEGAPLRRNLSLRSVGKGSVLTDTGIQRLATSIQHPPSSVLTSPREILFLDIVTGEKMN